ncbi:MAG: HPr-rel-A system PqqD family peptide chaperone [Gammaproteobacteria bacterium]
MRSPRWQVLEGFQLHWRTWDEETIVFQEGSGETHLLGPIEAAVLQRIERHPTTRNELASQLMNVLEAPLGAPLGDYLDHLLDRLCQVGLITPQNEGAGR